MRIGQYKFKPELSELTRAYFTAAARYERRPDIAAAMRAFAADPSDAKAIEVLRANPGTVGKIGTTCVATMINGGHALNALPQRATANINCRIFPGHPRAQILEELRQAAADPAVQFKDITQGSVPTDASPIRPDVVAAITRALHVGYPDVPVFPTMEAGASDSMWFRNEHIQLSNVRPSMSYLLSLLTDLSK